VQEKNQLLKRAQLTIILNIMQFYVILFIRKSKEDKMENFADYIDGCFEQKTDSESEEMKKTKL
jgi:hypothetical protein